jgi:hypothetical protein
MTTDLQFIDKVTNNMVKFLKDKINEMADDKFMNHVKMMLHINIKTKNDLIGKLDYLANMSVYEKKIFVMNITYQDIDQTMENLANDYKLKLTNFEEADLEKFKRYIAALQGVYKKK